MHGAFSASEQKRRGRCRSRVLFDGKTACSSPRPTRIPGDRKEFKAETAWDFGQFLRFSGLRGSRRLLGVDMCVGRTTFGRFLSQYSPRKHVTFGATTSPIHQMGVSQTRNRCPKTVVLLVSPLMASKRGAFHLEKLSSRVFEPPGSLCQAVVRSYAALPTLAKATPSLDAG